METVLAHEATKRENVVEVLKMNSMDHRGLLSIQFWGYFYLFTQTMYIH